MEAPRKKSAMGLQWKASSSSITDLPIPILMEILCRLPIKTLVAGKSVCKSWLHLTEDPEFTKLHQSKAPIEVCFNSHRDEITTKLYLGNFNFPQNSHCPIMKIDALFQLSKFSVRTNNTLNFKATKAPIRFANSCNGLLCFYGETNQFAMVWNPITSEVITVPAPPKLNYDLMLCAYGLGFSCKGNRFKLLRVVTRTEKGNWGWGFGQTRSVVLAEVCTIEKTRSWKKIDPSTYSGKSFSPQGGNLLSRAVFFQGALHWIVGGDSRPSLEVAMVSFDFDDDKFGQVLLPPQLDKYRSRPVIGVLECCLVVTDMVEGGGTNIWLMKEYGIRDSWMKVLSIGLTKFERYQYGCCVIPLTYLDNGEILMTRTVPGSTSITVVFSYNTVLERVTDLDCGPDEYGAVAYRPSLVSLKDSMRGCEVHLKPRPPEEEEYKKTTPTPNWWQSMEKFGSKSAPDRGHKACMTNAESCLAVMEKERKGHVNATPEFSVPESSAAKLACPQGNVAFTTFAHISGMGSVQPHTSMSSAQRTSTVELGHQPGSNTLMRDVSHGCNNEMSSHAKMDPTWEQIKTLTEEKLREELRMERQQRQELEKKLQELEEKLLHERAALKEQTQQTEQLKQQIHQFKDRSRKEQAKVEQAQTAKRIDDAATNGTR